MAFRKLSANLLAFCIVCLVATSVVQLCEGSGELCRDEEELQHGFNTSWVKGACPEGEIRICVNSSMESTTTSITTTTTTSDTTLDTSMSSQADSSPSGESKTEDFVLCAVCQPGHYWSTDAGSDTTTSSSADTTSTPVDTSSTSSETVSSTTTTMATSSSPDTTSSSVQTTGRQYRCLPCPEGVIVRACPVPLQNDSKTLTYIIIGAVVGGVVLIVIIVVTVVCCRLGKCCCQGRRRRSPPDSLQTSADGRNKDPENVEDDSRQKRKGRYTPMPGSQMGQHSSNAEDSEVDNLPMAPPPPPTGKSKRFSVKIQQLRSWKRSTKKRKEEPEDKKDGKDGGGYITMNNVTASRDSSPSSDPIYQNHDEAMASGGAGGEEIYQNDDQQEIYENQGMVDDQEIYENEEAIRVSGGQLPRPPAPAVDGEETYYNVGDEDYENPDGRHK